MTVVSALADACPSLAHHPGDLDAAHPATVVLDGRGSLWALYRCPVCGLVWACWWDARAAGWPINRIEGIAA